MQGCIGKVDRTNHRKILGKLPVNKAVETHGINLFVDTK
jgi:hypothetical protein